MKTQKLMVCTNVCVNFTDGSALHSSVGDDGSVADVILNDQLQPVDQAKPGDVLEWIDADKVSQRSVVKSTTRMPEEQLPGRVRGLLSQIDKPANRPRQP
jgi:hypothetical protein